MRCSNGVWVRWLMMLLIGLCSFNAMGCSAEWVIDNVGALLNLYYGEQQEEDPSWWDDLTDGLRDIWDDIF